jgi:UDP-N-acetylglucosamine--dolichyl-phosphate N-acetylglucosaminephosphotransferase
LVVLGPFIAATLSLFLFNNPFKKTFVGDTFCYFAGCVLCGAAIVGKYPVKLLFYFLP